MSHVHKNSAVVWILEDFQYFLSRIVFFAIIYYFFMEYAVVERVLAVLSVYFTVRFIKDIVTNVLMYRNFRYFIDRDMVYIRDGGFTVHQERVPIHRIQHVAIEQNTYSRFFGLYSLIIYTAGLNHTIEYVSKEEAEHWKFYIVSLLVNEENDDNVYETGSYN